ncbi:hypothetical protein BRC81_02600 [Halobacteriales archaeon QS_1_68_20]|nr:MAG: hypothetical protein BRC81_02600 [Halobacteriales archaeon QS_1_68_20]
MKPDPHPTADAESAVDHQSSLTGLTADGAHQVTLPGREASGARTGDSGEATVVNAFPMEDAVLVSHYFESDEAFGVLREYYDKRAYRFEIPRQAFRRVRAELAGLGYELRPVDDVKRYAVAVRKYTDHPEVVFGDSVAEFSVDGYNVFVMTDAAAVDAAVAAGAVRLADAPVTVRFPTAHGTGPLTVRDVTAAGD